MTIVSRAKNILTRPKSEWPVIGGEPATTGQLMTYAVVLSGIAQVCALIGSTLLTGLMGNASGMAAVGMTTGTIVVSSVIGWVFGLAILYVMSLIAAALAPSFDGRKDNLQALKLLVYAGTPIWVFGFLAIIPVLGTIAVLAGYVYAIYLIYVGASSTVGVPSGKSGGYAAVVVIIWLVLSFVIGGIIAAAVIGSAMTGGVATTY